MMGRDIDSRTLIKRKDRPLQTNRSRTLDHVRTLFIWSTLCCLVFWGGHCVWAKGDQGSTKEEMTMRLQLERKRVALQQTESQLKEKKDK